MPPRVPSPMMATPASTLPVGDDWSYEVKWDGYRTLALKDGPRVRLFSRNLKDVTGAYPSVARTLGELKAAAALVDGELVAIDEQGRPSFQALHHQAAHVVVFYAFDLLLLGERDLTREPLDSRRKQLAAAVTGTSILLSEPLPGTPAQIERAVRELGLEGVVAKRRSSRYEAGRRSDKWLKVKFSRRQEFVVGGYRPANNGFDSLLVGYYEGSRLYYAGKVRAGFTTHSRAELMRQLAPLSRRSCPFVNLPSTRSSHWGEGVTQEDMAAIEWVRPSVVVEIAFTEWTRDNNLRHAAYVGLREDKPAREVRRETA
jgi:bifunctional non-homologous end joining protein LigD